MDKSIWVKRTMENIGRLIDGEIALAEETKARYLSGKALRINPKTNEVYEDKEFDPSRVDIVAAILQEERVTTFQEIKEVFGYHNEGVDDFIEGMHNLLDYWRELMKMAAKNKDLGTVLMYQERIRDISGNFLYEVEYNDMLLVYVP